MDAAFQIPSVMSLPEFLVWDAPAGARWQLVDGEPRSMAPASRTHNLIQGELNSLIRNHLLACQSPCVVIPNPGVVPLVHPDRNFLIPDLAVTCTGYEVEEHSVTDPVLIIEILSPSNAAETWTNVAAYQTITSVREILIVRSTEIGADLLRRDTAGDWPDLPVSVTEGSLDLHSIGFSVDITALYRGTRLAPR